MSSIPQTSSAKSDADNCSFSSANKKFENIHSNKHLPIQHSILAQGEILITSGGSTLMFKHNTSATHPVFICTTKIIISKCHVNMRTTYKKHGESSHGLTKQNIK
jgi:hypothetical protein